MSNEKMGLVASVDAKLDAIGDKLKKKEWKVPTDLLGGVLFLIFGLVMLWLIPQQIEIKKKELVNGRAFPNLLMYVMIACSIILIVQQVIKLARRQEDKLTTVNLLVGAADLSGDDCLLFHREDERQFRRGLRCLRRADAFYFPLQKAAVLRRRDRRRGGHLGCVPLWLGRAVLIGREKTCLNLSFLLCRTC